MPACAGGDHIVLVAGFSIVGLAVLDIVAPTIRAMLPSGQSLFT